MAPGSTTTSSSSRIACRVYRLMLRDLGVGCPKGFASKVGAGDSWYRAGGRVTETDPAPASLSYGARCKPSDELVPLIDPHRDTRLKYGHGEYIGGYPTLKERVLSWGLVDSKEDSDFANPERIEAWVESLGLKETDTPLIPRKKLVELLRQEFRAVGSEIDPLDIFDRSATAREMLRHFNINSATTSFSSCGVLRVEISSDFRSNHREVGHNFFDYRVRIRNQSTDPSQKVRLIGRHWIFKELGGQVNTTVDKWATGVVGRSPLLGPGDGFEYLSGVTLESSAGTMEGSLLFEDLTSKQEYELKIDPTLLLSYDNKYGAQDEDGGSIGFPTFNPVFDPAKGIF